MTWKIDLGKEIRDARIAADKTQKELAQIIGVHENIVGRYERGVNVPSIEVLTAIAGVLEKPNFSVRGIRISFERNGAEPKLRPVPQQLRLAFDETGAVTVKIKPTPTHVIIEGASAWVLR